MRNYGQVTCMSGAVGHKISAVGLSQISGSQAGSNPFCTMGAIAQVVLGSASQK